MRNKAERLKSAKDTKREILNSLLEHESTTTIFFDIRFHSLKIKKEIDEYLIKKWSLKDTFKVIDEMAENPEKFREKIEKDRNK